MLYNDLPLEKDRGVSRKLEVETLRSKPHSLQG